MPWWNQPPQSPVDSTFFPLQKWSANANAGECEIRPKAFYGEGAKPAQSGGASIARFSPHNGNPELNKFFLLCFASLFQNIAQLTLREDWEDKNVISYIWRNKREVKNWQWSLYLSWSSSKHLCQERWKGRIGVARVTNGIKSIRPLGRTHWEASVGVPRKIGPEMLSKWARRLKESNAMDWFHLPYIFWGSFVSFDLAEWHFWEVRLRLCPCTNLTECNVNEWSMCDARLWHLFFYTSAINGPGQAANTMYQILTERVVIICALCQRIHPFKINSVTISQCLFVLWSPSKAEGGNFCLKLFRPQSCPEPQW